MTFGDEALFQSIINQFIEETESDVIKLNESLSGLNAISVREIVHKMAGRTGQMGMLSLSATLKEIEVNLIDGAELTTMIEPISRANHAVEKVLNAIRNHAFAQSSNP